MACHVRKNDTVMVIAGAHKGARGKVLRISRKREAVVVEGVNMVYRHVRPTRRNPQGGRLQKEAWIQLSKVLPYDTASGKPSRVRFEMERDAVGRVTVKRRVACKSGQALHTVMERKKG